MWYFTFLEISNICINRRQLNSHVYECIHYVAVHCVV